MSLRNRDMQVEQEIAHFLDEYLYPKNNILKKYNRVNDRESQLQGIDCTIRYKNKNIIIDEKAASHYINSNLPTFAFELGSYQRSGYVDGWLIDETKKTTHYLLIWIKTFTPCDKKAWINKNDIKTLECLLINKNDILSYLDNQGYTRDKLINKRNNIIKEKTFGPVDKNNQSEFYFFNTRDLEEAPVNIIIKKNKLKQMSIIHWLVSRESIVVC
ncbi:hypothetical protein OAR47_03625 [Gammaproteobacteria bacterium]|nr:hypothetical protein [Gammaproteobacteria bacterium]